MTERLLCPPEGEVRELPPVRRARSKSPGGSKVKSERNKSDVVSSEVVPAVVPKAKAKKSAVVSSSVDAPALLGLAEQTKSQNGSAEQTIPQLRGRTRASALVQEGAAPPVRSDSKERDSKPPRADSKPRTTKKSFASAVPIMDVEQQTPVPKLFDDKGNAKGAAEPKATKATRAVEEPVIFEAPPVAQRSNSKPRKSKASKSSVDSADGAPAPEGPPPAVGTKAPKQSKEAKAKDHAEAKEAKAKEAKAKDSAKKLKEPAFVFKAEGGQGEKGRRDSVC